MDEDTTVEHSSGALPQLDSDDCSILGTINLIGDRWTLGILRCVLYGYRRFSEFQRELGVAPNILTERLRALVQNGILQRAQYSERPQRFEYAMTEAAEELIPAFLLFKSWGDRHLRRESGPVTTLVHNVCGHDFNPIVVCELCRDEIDSTQLRVRWVQEEVQESRSSSEPDAP